jgi:HD-GYP domain-containing protein (c-di-GMP phosphodiesterase class II)
MTAAVCTKRSSEFVAIQVASIPALPNFDHSLYLQRAGGHEFKLYRDAGAELKASDLARLVDAGITTVFLDGGEYGRFQEELRTSLDAIVADERLPPAQRFSVVNEVVRGVLRDAFRRGNIDHTVKATGDLAEHVVDLVCRDDEVLSELNSVLHFDYSTFTHSANVGYYSLMLADKLGITDRAVLRKIGIGALLHDIGKLGIPEKILLKPGRLSPEEWNVLRAHPAKGLVALRDQDQLDFGQLMMVYQHHERIDGTGYPVRLEGNEIHEWARICAVADVYEALTSDRPYRRGLSRTVALEVIENGEGKGLEREFLQCWKKTITES